MTDHDQPDTLADIIRLATATGDMAAINNTHGTKADMVHAAVDAAIRAAVINGLIIVAPDAEERLVDGWGYRVWPDELTHRATKEN